MSKHTPGPWEMSGPIGLGHLQGREPWFWVSADRTLHLQVMACPDGFVIGENEANARLIAAAPDLLEALKMGYADTMDYIQRNHLSGAENNRWLVLARAAIAKAEGEPK
jgi:hypothetical protein